MLEEQLKLADGEIIPLRCVWLVAISRLNELSFHFSVIFLTQSASQLNLILPIHHYSVGNFNY